MGTTDKVNVLFVLTLYLFLFVTGFGVASAQEEVAGEGITDSAWIAISAGIVMAASVLAGSLVLIIAIRTVVKKPEILGPVLILAIISGGILFSGF